ncbi:uncharacterized protein KY384_002413 [Bacidia gigantensis]|uniref:uncharacterized protein n=1 Tax=Bacidia gigantensis TaxID=2732470 RepID=UPI001D0392EC|nr:uncharacterized protein KY384_002413 [Bacidia gigantensis]KAG8532536.1 hypothetical protein KY384_002413 [Bacidia gigantensis]
MLKILLFLIASVALSTCRPAEVDQTSVNDSSKGNATLGNPFDPAQRPDIRVTPNAQSSIKAPAAQVLHLWFSTVTACWLSGRESLTKYTFVDTLVPQHLRFDIEPSYKGQTIDIMYIGWAVMDMITLQTSTDLSDEDPSWIVPTYDLYIGDLKFGRLSTSSAGALDIPQNMTSATNGTGLASQLGGNRKPDLDASSNLFNGGNLTDNSNPELSIFNRIIETKEGHIGIGPILNLASQALQSHVWKNPPLERISARLPHKVDVVTVETAEGQRLLIKFDPETFKIGDYDIIWWMVGSALISSISRFARGNKDLRPFLQDNFLVVDGRVQDDFFLRLAFIDEQHNEETMPLIGGQIANTTAAS